MCTENDIFGGSYISMKNSMTKRFQTNEIWKVIRPPETLRAGNCESAGICKNKLDTDQLRKYN